MFLAKATVSACRSHVLDVISKEVADLHAQVALLNDAGVSRFERLHIDTCNELKAAYEAHAVAYMRWLAATN